MDSARSEQQETEFGVEPYGPEESVIHACGLLDVIKTEWGEAWSEHDQKVRAGLSRILSSDLLKPAALAQGQDPAHSRDGKE